MSIYPVLRITGAELVNWIEQTNIVTARQAFVQHYVQVHVHLVHREIEAAREQAAELDWLRQRLADERDVVVSCKAAADEIRRRRPAVVRAIGEVDSL